MPIARPQELDVDDWVRLFRGVSVLYRCYAKINLTLEVLRRRDDGYHDLASVVHTISLADDLTHRAADEIRYARRGTGAELEDNLVMRAARLLADDDTRARLART